MKVSSTWAKVLKNFKRPTIIFSGSTRSWNLRVILYWYLQVEDGNMTIYLDLARIFLRFLFSLRILFFRHLALILNFVQAKMNNRN